MPARRRKSLQKTAVAGHDPFWEIISQHRPSILRLYARYADHNPVVLFDVQEQRVYAYPFSEFRAELSQRSQASLTRQYERALADGCVVVFVRDNEQERLVSYSVLLDCSNQRGIRLPMTGRPPGRWSGPGKSGA